MWRLDRLGRSLSDVVKTAAELEHRGVHFEMLDRNDRDGKCCG
ncbi:recombinase family protein [uncultured Stutzerimonas sp.]